MSALLPVLETARLRLRPFQASDATRVQLLAGDRLVAATTLNLPHPYPDGAAEEWIATHESDFLKRDALVLGICLKTSVDIIGCTGLTLKMNYSLGELGYWVGVEFWNNGYCTEACRAIMGYGFHKIGLNKIFATYFASNKASGRVMQKLGMRQESYMHRHLYHWGMYHDLVGYGILKEEFETIESA